MQTPSRHLTSLSLVHHRENRWNHTNTSPRTPQATPPSAWEGSSRQTSRGLHLARICLRVIVMGTPQIIVIWDTDGTQESSKFSLASPFICILCTNCTAKIFSSTAAKDDSPFFYFGTIIFSSKLAHGKQQTKRRPQGRQKFSLMVFSKYQCSCLAP